MFELIYIVFLLLFAIGLIIADIIITLNGQGGDDNNVTF